MLMRVFIGYGYNERDKWVESYVVPLVVAFGCDVKHGKAVYGGALPDEVLKSIRSSDAMIGFTTRREPAGQNQAGQDQFSTHPWVIHELGAALNRDPRIPFVEVRESGVISPGGMIEAANQQRIEYQETDRALCLLQIAAALRRFREQTNVTLVRLRPASMVDQICSFLDDPSFVCRCKTLQRGVEFPAQEIPVIPIKGGLFVQLHGLEDGALVRITLSAGGRTWQSTYESVDTVDIELKNRE